MKKFGIWLMAAGCAAGVWTAQAMAPRPPRPAPVALIVPARMRVLQAAFDLRQLRGAALFAYRTDPGRLSPDVFQWNAGAWQLLAGVEFEEILRSLPGSARVAVAGGPGVLPGTLAATVAAAAPGALHFPTLQPADLFNGLDEVCRFTPREWEWLAARYNLTLTDVNATQRAYNPYAVRQSELPLAEAEFPAEDGGLPPADLELPAE